MEHLYHVWNDEWYADMPYSGWKEYTSAALISLFTLLQCDGGTELGHIVTTLDDDSYSDNLVDALHDIYSECNNIEEALRLAETDKVVLTCKTYWRCMQIHSSGEQMYSDAFYENIWLENITEELQNFAEE